MRFGRLQFWPWIAFVLVVHVEWESEESLTTTTKTTMMKRRESHTAFERWERVRRRARQDRRMHRVESSSSVRRGGSVGVIGGRAPQTFHRRASFFSSFFVSHRRSRPKAMHRMVAESKSTPCLRIHLVRWWRFSFEWQMLSTGCRFGFGLVLLGPDLPCRWLPNQCRLLKGWNR